MAGFLRELCDLKLRHEVRHWHCRFLQFDKDDDKNQQAQKDLCSFISCSKSFK